MKVSDRERRIYRTYMGLGPEGRIPHWEAWSNPDAETFITGIDYYDRPRDCRLKMKELYPELGLRVPEDNSPKQRPKLGKTGAAVNEENRSVRWGDGETATFLHGEKFFKIEEDVFAFNPLEHADMRGWPHVVDNWNFSSEDTIYERYAGHYPSGLDRATAESASSAGFYNTMFMWPLLVFGWEMFLTCCLDERFAPVMEGFAELNRRVFRALCRLPVNFLMCHDDIATTRGPVCSKEWMHRYIYPRYEEFWGMAKATGKSVIFITDGCADMVADDVFACGAQGIYSEPHTDFKALARRHNDKMLCGEGDNRILTYGSRGDIEKMVRSMLETSKQTGGYTLGIGNHIPWNVPPASVKLYLDLCNELAYR